MDITAAFNRVMNKGTNIALATSVNDQSNVRVVTFAYEATTPGKVYFTTFPGNKKIEEFENNNKISFVSLPSSELGEIQVRCRGTVKRSERPLSEVASLILAKMPAYQNVLNQAADILLVYEIEFEEAQVTIGIDAAKTIQVA